MKHRLRIRSYNVKRSTGGRVQLSEDRFYAKRRIEKVEAEKVKQEKQGAA